MAEENCAHLNCNCEIPAGTGVAKDGKTYCSEFCASTEEATLDDCRCGHRDCE